MKTVNVKDIRYDYGKFYVKGVSEMQGGGIKAGIPDLDEYGKFTPEMSCVYVFDEAETYIGIDLPENPKVGSFIIFVHFTDALTFEIIPHSVPFITYEGTHIELNHYYEFNFLFNGLEWVLKVGDVKQEGLLNNSLPYEG